jgi:putative pyruvate formate lyase activating enzyme
MLEKLKKDSFPLPVIWNSGGYESLSVIKKLKGLVDIYLPDFKYSDNGLAVSLSSAPRYLDNIIPVLQEMRTQVKDEFEDGFNIMKSGMIIRHLVLPSHTGNSKGVLSVIRDVLGTGTVISLMSQYFPSGFVKQNTNYFNEISRILDYSEYEEVCSFLYELGFTNGYCQELSSASDDYVPAFKK